MAVLNPLLALIQNNERPKKVLLFGTRVTFGRAESIKDFLVEHHGYAGESISVQQVSDTLEENENGLLPVQRLVASLQEENEIIGFNMAGGLNFQVAACARILKTDNCVLFYPESETVHAIKMKNSSVSEHVRYPLPLRQPPIPGQCI